MKRLALTLYCSLGLGMMPTPLKAQATTMISLAHLVTKTGSSHHPVPMVDGRPVPTGEEWLIKNIAHLESGDRYWVAASKQASEMIAKASARPKPYRAYGGNEHTKAIALTFDDGPHVKWTDALISVLHNKNIKATFFVVGKMVRKNPDLLRSIHADGHEIGNHSFSHVTLSKLTFQEAITEYLANQFIIRDTAAVSPIWCRPPGGRYSQETFEAAGMVGLRTALWTTDPLDYAFPGPDRLMRRLKRDLKPGAVYLLHSGAPDTLKVLPAFIDYAEKQGYKFVTLTQLHGPSAAK